mgnify:FL=1
MERREKYGKLRPLCPSCGHIHFDDPKVAAAVVVEHDGKILLTRRVNDPQRGLWTVPGGFVDAGEDPKEAAVRECEEETGLKVEVTELLDVIAGREHTRGASFVIFYRGRVISGTLAAHDDADDVGFFAKGELPVLAFETTKKILELWKNKNL